MSDRSLPSQLSSSQATAPDADNWFLYPVKAYPHHTDYGGIVWHGTYVTWMEAARIECLRSLGIEYSNLVELGYELLVVDLSIRYHKPLRLGMEAVIKTRVTDTTGVRLPLEYEIRSVDETQLFVTAWVNLVTIDRQKGKIMRQLPPQVKDAIVKLYT